MHLRRLKDVAKKTSFLRCIWDISKTSQKRRLFWDVSEMSLRCLSQRRPNWDVSETSHAGWVTTLTFHVCFSSIYEFKFTSFLKACKDKKNQARWNRTKNNNNGLKIKDKETKGSTCHDNPAIIFIANFSVDCPTEFPLITVVLELSTPLIRSTFIQIHFYRHPFSIKRSW